jgi:hypothetical protein
MSYQKINLELVVFSDEADKVVAELNSTIDRLEETCAIFGGTVEAIPVSRSGTRRKSAFRHTLDAGNAVTSSLKSAAQNVVDAYKKVI